MLETNVLLRSGAADAVYVQGTTRRVASTHCSWAYTCSLCACVCVTGVNSTLTTIFAAGGGGATRCKRIQQEANTRWHSPFSNSKKLFFPANVCVGGFRLFSDIDRVIVDALIARPLWRYLECWSYNDWYTYTSKYKYTACSSNTGPYAGVWNATHIIIPKSYITCSSDAYSIGWVLVDAWACTWGCVKANA